MRRKNLLQYFTGWKTSEIELGIDSKEICFGETRMIKVDRSLVPLSASATRALKSAHLGARDFYLKDEARSQKRFSFVSDPWHMTRPALRELFDNTCAYCETPSEMVDLTIEHFRPVAEASNLDGVSASDWYWWLAYRWENLYLACSECIQHKNNLFPVNGDRLPSEKVIGEKYKENYRLVDPCADDPTEHLRFVHTGLVEPLSQKTGEGSILSRGATTIEVLGLNRQPLVQRRKDVADRVLKQLDGFPKLVREYTSDRLRILTETLDEMVDEFSSFVALKRCIVARFVIANAAVYRKLRERHPTAIKQVDKAIKKYVEVESRFPQEPLPGLVVPSITEEVSITYDNAYIQRIEIKNFRNIHELDIKLKTELTDHDVKSGTTADAQPDPAVAIRAGWKMMLGENGFGKSSVLKAVALALMGKDHYDAYAKKSRLDTPNIFNRRAKTKSGLIKVTLSKGEPIEVRFTSSRLRWVSGENAAKGVFVRGYGSARLFAPISDDEPETNARQDPLPTEPRPIRQVDNLFHPAGLLSHPAEWLKENLDILDSTALSFRDLLNLPEHVELPLKQDGGEILLDTGNGPVPLAEQSDGYKTVLAFVLDILAGLPKSLRDKRTATGIVLIDELDSHLHPRWKMRIVRSLRQAFPRLQFIATTHEPLCLRGLGKDEIAVLRKKTDDVIEVIDDVPSPEDLRVDQLLTSEFFGLESTIDPVVDEKFYNYYQLLANSTEASNKLSVDERKKRAEDLGRQLEKYNTLGFTRRDRMVYRLIDEYLAKKDRLPKPQQKKLGEETKKRVFELWDLIGLRYW